MLRLTKSKRIGQRGISQTGKPLKYRHALLLVFLLIAVSLPMEINSPHLAAAAGATLTVAAASGQPGEQVQVPVLVDTGGVAIQGLQVNVDFPGASLTNPVGSAGTMLPEPWIFQSNSPAPGELRFVAIDPTGVGQALDGAVFMMAFTISADATAGDVPVNLALVDMLDSSSVAQDVIANGGVITVIVNQPPSVEAGADITITFASPATGSLNAIASDDGLPNPPASLTLAWTMVSGPAPATFSDSGALNSLDILSHCELIVQRSLKLGVMDAAQGIGEQTLEQVHPLHDGHEIVHRKIDAEVDPRSFVPPAMRRQVVQNFRRSLKEIFLEQMILDKL